jgi:hypothetical protein
LLESTLLWLSLAHGVSGRSKVFNELILALSTTLNFDKLLPILKSSKVLVHI